MLNRAHQQLEPTDKERVGKMLAVVAKMIGAPIPDPEVISMYIGILSEYPNDLIDMMGKHVIRTHKYNTFPRVADFEASVRDLLQIRQRNLKETIETRKWYGLK